MRVEVHDATAEAAELITVSAGPPADTDACPTEPDIQLVNFPYGAMIADDTGEWRLVILMSSGQDGRVNWAVILVEVDGGLQTRVGLTPWGHATRVAIEKACFEVTMHWIEPINAMN